jgi:hypothetical protein
MAYRDMRSRLVYGCSKSRLMFKVDGAVAQINNKVVTFPRIDVEIGRALANF